MSTYRTYERNRARLPVRFVQPSRVFACAARRRRHRVHRLLPDPEWDLCPSVDGKCVAEIPDEVANGRFLEELSSHIRKLRTPKKRVIVSLPFPLYDKSIPDLQIRNAIFQQLRLPPITSVELIRPGIRNQIASIAQSTGAEIFDPRSALCATEGCITTLDGVSIYKDHSHIAASQIAIL
jgi:SGNH domain (fused to AT3 domains)